MRTGVSGGVPEPACANAVQNDPETAMAKAAKIEVASLFISFLLCFESGLTKGRLSEVEECVKVVVVVEGAALPFRTFGKDRNRRFEKTTLQRFGGGARKP